MAEVTLFKYHGLGNDFLIWLEPCGQPGHAIEAATVRALCNRRSGVGADGLLRGTMRVDPGLERDGAARPAAEVLDRARCTMELWNADGSRAEISGNGLRCLAACVADAGLVEDASWVVATSAGPRRVWVERAQELGFDGAGASGPAGRRRSVTVEMGPVRLALAELPGGELPEGCVAYEAEVGNPHLVILAPAPGMLAIAEVGPRYVTRPPSGCNVELVTKAPGTSDQLELEVFERGVGETPACGSGSCAAAAAALALGWIGDEAIVRNPGGSCTVALRSEPTGALTARLTGPAVRIAALEVQFESSS